MLNINKVAEFLKNLLGKSVLKKPRFKTNLAYYDRQFIKITKLIKYIGFDKKRFYLAVDVLTATSNNSVLKKFALHLKSLDLSVATKINNEKYNAIHAFFSHYFSTNISVIESFPPEMLMLILARLPLEDKLNMGSSSLIMYLKLFEARQCPKTFSVVSRITSSSTSYDKKLMGIDGMNIQLEINKSDFNFRHFNLSHGCLRVFNTRMVTTHNFRYEPFEIHKDAVVKEPTARDQDLSLSLFEEFKGGRVSLVEVKNILAESSGKSKVYNSVLLVKCKHEYWQLVMDAKNELSIPLMDDKKKILLEKRKDFVTIGTQNFTLKNGVLYKVAEREGKKNRVIKKNIIKLYPLNGIGFACMDTDGILQYTMDGKKFSKFSKRRQPNPAHAKTSVSVLYGGSESKTMQCFLQAILAAQSCLNTPTQRLKRWLKTFHRLNPSKLQVQSTTLHILRHYECGLKS